jgi:methyl-accepting chemotaxis protein
MTEVVDSIQNVTITVSEISLSSKEQSQAIGQIQQAITSLDDVTQQNAALVEEAAAAAASLNEQATNLTQVVSAFKLGTLIQSSRQLVRY